MKISYNWLREYIDVRMSWEQFKDRLTFSGIEVEAVEHVGENLKQLIVAEIVSREKHPDSDHLSVCRVSDGNDLLQIVCGAPNCDAGLKVALAPVGAKIGDIVIKKAKLRGVESSGMLCSERELGLSENHAGILILPGEYAVGQNLADALGLADTVFDVEITPNRPDLLGMLGVAMDLSALLTLPVTRPVIDCDALKIDKGLPIGSVLTLHNEAPEKCLRYTAHFVRGVKVAPSPDWLQTRLRAAGIRPINNIVDITNYVMLEFGHPLHAFDYNCLEDGTIRVRPAVSGETILALDGNTYQLDPSDLVIADNRKPVAIAGVMGGELSGIRETTRDIVIESANFLYSSVRKTTQRLKVFSDSSYRFERGMSDEYAGIAGRRAVKLILDIAGGVLADGCLDSWPNPRPARIVGMRPDRARWFLNIDTDNQGMKRMLESLGLETVSETSEQIEFRVPPNRRDLEREIDLFEELIRLYDLNKVPQKTKIPEVMNRVKWQFRRDTMDAMVENGFHECVNWPFADPEALDLLKIDSHDLRREVATIVNPIGVRYSIMQTTLLPNMLRNGLNNFNHNQNDQKIFEVSKVYFRKDEKLAREHWHLAALCSGFAGRIHWQSKPVELDFFHVKGVVESLLDRVGRGNTEYSKSTEPFLHPGLSADVALNGKKIGWFGRLDSKIALGFDLDKPVWVMEFDLDDILGVRDPNPPAFSEIPRLLDVRRDISFVVPREQACGSIEKTIFAAGKGRIRDIVLFDEYQGEHVPDGHRSLSFSLALNTGTEGLTEEAIQKIISDIIKRLESEHQIRMR